MNSHITTQVLDDDQLLSNCYSYKLHKRFPGMEIIESDLPQLNNQCQVFIIDDYFKSTSYIHTLVHEARFKNPNCFIIAISTYFSHDTIKELIAMGCNGFIEKSNKFDFNNTCDLLQEYIDRHESDIVQNEDTHTFVGALISIKNLLNSWNTKLLLSA